MWQNLIDGINFKIQRDVFACDICIFDDTIRKIKQLNKNFREDGNTS